MQTSLVIGGGFFGMYVSEFLAKRGRHVILIEKEDDFMQRASFVNQARVHNGYHYPRSILTALRSRISLPRFCEEFRHCIDNTFDNYYLISNLQSKVTANQFEKFCHRIGAVCEPAPSKIEKLVDKRYVEAVFTTSEYAFDSNKLKENMLDRITKAGVQYFLNKNVQSVEKKNKKLIAKVCPTNNQEESSLMEVDDVFNCTYSMINQIINDSNLDMISLKHELAEIALVEMPDELKNMGVTVMDGPFFSVMPFPPRKLHTFSHVRYTPHYEWYDSSKQRYRSPHQHLDEVKKISAWTHMYHDAIRYMPLLSECRYKGSIWEVKTVLPRSESDDSRPILFKPNHGLKGFHSIMGGKIDNVYDAIQIIEKTGFLRE
jgi:glycine/D-amino acid oxidase-like deaminating enzyme